MHGKHTTHGRTVHGQHTYARYTDRRHTYNKWHDGQYLYNTRTNGTQNIYHGLHRANTQMNGKQPTHWRTAQDNTWEWKHTGTQTNIATHWQHINNIDQWYTNSLLTHGKQTTHTHMHFKKNNTHSQHTDERYIDNTHTHTTHRPHTVVRFTDGRHTKPMDGWYTKYLRTGCTQLIHE